LGDVLKKLFDSVEKKLEKKVGTLKKHNHKINIATFGDLWRPLDPRGTQGLRLVREEEGSWRS
jgi:hypothetical protein